MKGKGIMSNEDRVRYMLDTYQEMYELPFAEFIFQLKNKNNADKDLEDALSEVLKDMQIHTYDYYNLKQFIGSLVWAKELCNFESPTIEVRRYVQNRILEFIKNNSIHENAFANPLLTNAIFLMACYKIVFSLDQIGDQEAKGNTEKMECLDKKNEPKAVKPEISNAPISETSAYALATLACGIVFILYQVIAVAVFGWKYGGGFLPMFILLTVLVRLWKWIVSFSKTQAEIKTTKAIREEHDRIKRTQLEKNIIPIIVYILAGIVIILSIYALISIL